MADKKNSRWKLITDQLKNKYRLVILNDDSFEEKFSLRLSPLGLIILITSITIVMTTIVISLVAFTPFREYIPGYGNVNDRKDIIALNLKTDSLASTLQSREWYIQNLLNVFSGKVEGKPAKPSKDSTGKYKQIDIKPGENDIKLRSDIETNHIESTSIKVSANKNSELNNYVFYCPVKGIISNSYNLKENHFGVDIVGKPDEPIKTVLDGTIIFSGLTKDDGYVIQVQHTNNLISVYKHCSSLSKKTGDYVKTGEQIAIIGNTGESSTGPHLHFEIWYNGFAINPQDYVAF